MDRLEILTNPSKNERMTSIDRLEIIANPSKKESALFSREVRNDLNAVHDVMHCFYGGRHKSLAVSGGYGKGGGGEGRKKPNARGKRKFIFVK